MKVNYNILRTSLSIFVFLLMSCALSAKDHYVYGSVVDNFHKRPIPGMNVALLYADSTIVSICCVEERKYDEPPRTVFSLPVKKEGKYILRFSMIGYQTTYANVDIKFRRNSYVVEVGRFEIGEQIYKLKETSVVATQIKMVMKGDTVIYNAAAFQLPEGSMLDALVSQLPGVELKNDGRIFVNGKFVENLLLNGKNFYKGDPKVALENLSAYMVDKVKVYEKSGKLSEFMNQDRGDKEYVMDVHLKKQYSIGWISNAELGGGTTERYMARLFGLRFTANSRLNVFANINNVNDNRRPSRNGDWRPSDLPTGLQTTQVGGISYNLEKIDENRLYVTLDGKVEHYNTTTEVDANNVTFLPAGDMFSRSYSKSRNKRTSYSSYISVDYWKGKKYSIGMDERLYCQTSDNSGFSRLGTFSSNPLAVISGNMLDSLFAPDMGSAFRQILINRQWQERKEEGDYLSSFTNITSLVRLGNNPLAISAFFQYNKEKLNTFVKRRLDYFQNSALSNSDYRNQYFHQPGNRHRYSVQARYDYRFADNPGVEEINILLAPYYTIDDDYKSSKSFLYRLDQLPGWETEETSQSLGILPSAADVMQTVIDERNSYESEIHETEHEFRLRLLVTNFKKGSCKFTLEANLKAGLLRQKLDYYRNNKYYPLTRTSFLPRPNASVTLETNKGQFEWNYEIKSQAPTLTHLLDIRDDSDPLNIFLGNTDLKDMHTHTVTLTFRKFRQKTQSNFFLYTGFRYTKNATAMGVTYNRETGVRTYRPDNINGNYAINSNILYGRALGEKQRWSFHTTTRFSYNHNVDLIGVEGATQSLRSVVNNVYLTEELNLDYRLGSKLSLGMKGNGTWTHATGKREDFSTINAADFNYGLTAQVELPWKMQLSTDLTQYCRRGYEDPGMNTDELTWNARLSKSCMKGNLTFMLDAFDILGNLSNVRRTLNAQGRTESYYNVIPRYAMLHVIYKLNIQPKKKK